MTAKPRPSQSRTLNEVERLINDRLPDDWTLALTTLTVDLLQVL